MREGLDLPLSVIWSIAVQVALLGMAEPAGGAAPPVRFVHPATHVHRFISLLTLWENERRSGCSTRLADTGACILSYV